MSMSNSNSNNLDHIFSQSRRQEPHIPDNGFTTAVMAQLPDPYELPLWQKNLLMLGATAIGSAACAWQLPLEQLPALLSIQSLTLPFLAGAAVVVYLASYSVIWAVQKEVI